METLSFFLFFLKFHNQLLSTSHSATCQAMISETLAAVEKFSKILEFFSTAAKGLFFGFSKTAAKKSKTLNCS